jgi:hypothetical protein
MLLPQMGRGHAGVVSAVMRDNADRSDARLGCGTKLWVINTKYTRSGDLESKCDFKPLTRM